jgi:hypothetical protein
MMGVIAARMKEDGWQWGESNVGPAGRLPTMEMSGTSNLGKHKNVL